jgi:Spy/CpxP family protein refolding chaperone
MKTKLTLLAVIATLTALPLFAQQMPPGKWWQRPEIVHELQLTTEQQDRLDATYRAAANDLIDAKAEIEKLQVALRGEIDRPQLRRQEIQKLAAQVSTARARLFERELMMLVDMRAVLNEQQWNHLRTKLDQMRERRQEAGRPQRPGVMNRPGAGRRRP